MTQISFDLLRFLAGTLVTCVACHQSCSRDYVALLVRVGPGGRQWDAICHECAEAIFSAAVPVLTAVERAITRLEVPKSR